MFSQKITEILLSVPGILIGLVFHEFCHALVADRLGDNTPRYQGRLTLSPLVHLDPIGFLLIMFAGFGWAKPVQINPRNLKSPRRDDALISFAGPLGNLFIAIVFAVLLKTTYVVDLSNTISPTIWGYFQYILKFGVYINVFLCLFNLIPIPPLDGSHILESFTNVERFEFYHTIKQYSMFILILIIATPVVSNIITPPANIIIGTLFSVLGLG